MSPRIAADVYSYSAVISACEKGAQWETWWYQLLFLSDFIEGWVVSRSGKLGQNASKRTRIWIVVRVYMCPKQGRDEGTQVLVIVFMWSAPSFIDINLLFLTYLWWLSSCQVMYHIIVSKYRIRVSTGFERLWNQGLCPTFAALPCHLSL